MPIAAKNWSAATSSSLKLTPRPTKEKGGPRRNASPMTSPPPPNLPLLLLECDLDDEEYNKIGRRRLHGNEHRKATIDDMMGAFGVRWDCA